MVACSLQWHNVSTTPRTFKRAVWVSEMRHGLVPINQLSRLRQDRTQVLVVVIKREMLLTWTKVRLTSATNTWQWTWTLSFHLFYQTITLVIATWLLYLVNGFAWLTLISRVSCLFLACISDVYRCVYWSYGLLFTCRITTTRFEWT